MIAPRDVPRILKLKRSGYTWAGIALAMGCSEAIARQAVNQRARADKVRQLIRDRNFQIRELGKLGESPHTIAHAFGVTTETVRNIIQPRGRKAKK